MGQFIFRRTIYAIVTLFILSLTIFVAIRLTGDPVTLLAEPGAREEDLARVRSEWGLDRPWPVQYFAFARNIVTGELGKSFNYQMPVSLLYFQRLPNSLELAAAATLMSFLIGIPAGLISAVKLLAELRHQWPSNSRQRVKHARRGSIPNARPINSCGESRRSLSRGFHQRFHRVRPCGRKHAVMPGNCRAHPQAMKKPGAHWRQQPGLKVEVKKCQRLLVLVAPQKVFQLGSAKVVRYPG